MYSELCEPCLFLSNRQASIESSILADVLILLDIPRHSKFDNQFTRDFGNPTLTRSFETALRTLCWYLLRPVRDVKPKPLRTAGAILKLEYYVSAKGSSVFLLSLTK